MTTRFRVPGLMLILILLLLAGCAKTSTPEPIPTSTATVGVTVPAPTATTEPAPSATPVVEATHTAAPPATATPEETGEPTPGGSAENGLAILAFADSLAGTYDVALPILQARGIRAMAYLHIEPIVQGKASHLTPEECDALHEAGWELASHGYMGGDPRTMTDAELEHHLKDAQDWLLARGYTRGARNYGPPGGRCDERVRAAALVYYDTMWCGQFSEMPAGYRFGVVGVANARDWETEVRPHIDRVLGTPDTVVRISFHDIVQQNPAGLDTDAGRLTQILDYLEEKAIRIVTLSDLLDGNVE